MSNMTPFEIRLELLKMARDMLNDDYYGKREQISNQWQVEIDSNINYKQWEEPNYHVRAPT